MTGFVAFWFDFCFFVVFDGDRLSGITQSLEVRCNRGRVAPYATKAEMFHQRILMSPFAAVATMWQVVNDAFYSAPARENSC